MVITISRQEHGHLKLYSKHPVFKKFVDEHVTDFADYEDRNVTGSKAIYCYDNSLFTVMWKIGSYFADADNEPICFDIE